MPRDPEFESKTYYRATRVEELVSWVGRGRTSHKLSFSYRQRQTFHRPVEPTPEDPMPAPRVLWNQRYQTPLILVHRPTGLMAYSSLLGPGGERRGRGRRWVRTTRCVTPTPLETNQSWLAICGAIQGEANARPRDREWELPFPAPKDGGFLYRDATYHRWLQPAFIREFRDWWGALGEPQPPVLSDLDEHYALARLLIWAAYPTLREFAEAGYRCTSVPGSLSPAFRQPNLRAFAQALTGSTGRLMVRRLAESLQRDGRQEGQGLIDHMLKGNGYFLDMSDADGTRPPVPNYLNYDNLVLVQLLKGRVPVDYLQEVLTWPMAIPYYRSRRAEGPMGTYLNVLAQLLGRTKNFKQVRKILGHYTPRRQMRLLQDLACPPGHMVNFYNPIDGAFQELQDSLRILHEAEREGYQVTLPPDPRTWEDIHDHLMRENNQHFLARHQERLEFPGTEAPPPAANDDLNPPEAWLKLEGTPAGPFTLTVPRTRTQLREWGAEMRHCIGGYGGEMQQRRCLLLGLLKDGKLVYNLEITNGGILRQFYGKANSLPTQADRDVVVAVLRERSLVKEDPNHLRVREGNDALPAEQGGVPVWEAEVALMADW